MSLINIQNLTFAYDGSYDNIFENVSFQIDTDWKLGFTGRNGRGKTTFLNLLMGKYEYGGRISSSVNFEYFPFPIKDEMQNTVEIIEYVVPDFELWELYREISLLEVNEDVLFRPFSTLSNGERTKVLLAALFLKSNNFLLIDEPTNHLDRDGRATVSRYLNSKKGFILISHDRMFLDQCIDHILSINKTNIEIQKGNFSSWWINKQMQDDFELAENAKLQKDIKKLTAAAARASSWSDQIEKTKNRGKVPGGRIDAGVKPDKGHIGRQAAKMMKHSKALEGRQQNAIERKSKLLKNIETADHLSIKPMPYHTDRLMEWKDVSLFYGNQLACSNVTFEVHRGDRIAIEGKNGAGKSSILKLIMEQYSPQDGLLSFTGSLHIGSNLIVSYVPQDTSFLKGDLSDFSKAHQLNESLFKAILRKLDFSRTQFEKDMEDFSGGQKKKVLLAKSLCEKAHLYIWDEPLNFIDVLSRMQIEELILTHCPTMLFVEHDAAFIQTIATKTIIL